MCCGFWSKLHKNNDKYILPGISSKNVAQGVVSGDIKVLDPEVGTQKATVAVLLVVVVISSLRVQKCLRVS